MATTEWELSKENVQPLRKGRKVEVLNENLKTKEEGTTRANIFETQRKQMIEAIDSYEGDDPLKPWLQCIKWVKDAYPSGGAQSELLPLLEACTRTFQSDERYKSDLRYLRVWVNYADCCTEPRDIFTFLEVHSIGQDHALYYEAYATYTEVCKNFSKANEIYELGIQRGAQPTLRLENMYQSFLKRMMKRNERKLQEDQDDTSEPEKLRTFGESRTPHSGISARNPPSFQEQQRRRVQPPQTQRPGIAIYVDTEFEPGTHPSSTQPFANAHAPAAPAWKSLSTQADVRKENSQVPAKWTETKVPRMGKVPKHVTAHPAINVYVDEECELEQARMKAKNESAVPATLPLRLDGVPDHRRDQEALNKNPLLHFTEGYKPSLTALMGRKPADSNGEAHGDDTSTGCEIYKAREDAHEFSFEEARLLKWKSSNQNLQWAPASSPRNSSAEKAKMIEKSLNMFQSECARRRSQELSPVTKMTDREPLASDCPLPRSSMRDLGTKCSNQIVLGGNSSSSSSEESFAFCMPPPPQLRPSLSSASSVSSIDDPPAFHCSMLVSQNGSALASVMSTNGDETVIIKRYAEELITLGADPNAKSIDAGGHQGLLDQTINTKECLQDILSMFNRPLSCEKPRPRAKTNNPARPAGPASNEGFQVFVDEDLDAPPAPRDSRIPKKQSFGVFQDEENVPRRSGKAPPTGAVKKGGFQVFVDEDLDAPPLNKNTRVPKKETLEIFQDEENVPRKSGKESFAIFEDDAMMAAAPGNVDKRICKSKHAAGKPKDSGFAIFEDDDLSANQPVSNKPPPPGSRLRR